MVGFRAPARPISDLSVFLGQPVAPITMQHQRRRFDLKGAHGGPCPPPWGRMFMPRLLLLLLCLGAAAATGGGMQQQHEAVVVGPSGSTGTS